MSSTSPNSSEKELDSKKLSLFELIALGVGSVIGSGIFAMVGVGIAQTGRSVNIALIMGILFVTLMMVPSIYLSSVIPLEGGNYTQAAVLMKKRNAGIFSIIFFFTNLSISIYVISIADYLLEMLPVLGPYHKLICMIVMTLFFLLNVRGTKFIAKAQGIMTVVMIVALMTFLVIGLPKVNAGYFTEPGFMTAGTGGLLVAAATMSFAAQGGATIINYSGASRKPKRDIPLSMLLTSLIVAVVYFCMGTVAAGILPVEQVANKTLGIVAKSFLPNYIYYFFIIGGAMFALSTSLNNLLGYIKYPILKCTEDGWLPKALSKKTKKYEFPYVLMGLLYLLGAVPILTGLSLDILASLVLIPSYLFGIVMMFATLKVPKMFPKQWAASSFKVPKPVLWGTIILAAFVSLAQALLMFFQLPLFMMAANIIMFILLYLYCCYREKKGYVHMEYIEDMIKNFD